MSNELINSLADVLTSSLVLVSVSSLIVYELR